MKSFSEKPRTDYVNDCQGIGTNYSRFLEKFELSKGSIFLRLSPFPVFLRKHKDEFHKQCP